MFGKKYYLLLASGIDVTKRDAITIHLSRKSGWNWNHYLADTWFIVDPLGVSTAKSLAEEFDLVVPNMKCVVMQVEGQTKWYGKGDKEMWEWFSRAWPGSVSS